MIDDFNLIITTLRGLENQLCSEMEYLLTEELGGTKPIIEKTEIRGLVVAKISLDPLKVVKKLRSIIHEHPYKIRYALRIIPIQKVILTNLEEIRQVSTDFTKLIPEKNSFRITIEKRYTSIHTKDFIEAAASNVKRKVDLEKPDFILLIEVLGDITGISLIKPNDILAVTKEKML